MRKKVILLFMFLLVVVRGKADVVNINDWVMATDGSQYPWVTEKYRWGAGRMKVNGTLAEYSPDVPLENGLIVRVAQKIVGDDLIETYTFSNEGRETLQLSDIEVNTPLNDNYPNAETCLANRFHAHIWAAGTAGYVNAIRMSAKAPHLGLMMVKGGLDGYSIHERGGAKGSSNFRGVIALNITPDGIPGHSSITLRKGQSFSFSWRLFEHKGWEDFYAKMIERGGMQVNAKRYVGKLGSVLTYEVKTSKGIKTKQYTIDRVGDIRVPIKFRKGETYIELLGVREGMEIATRRADFILNHQIYHAAEGDEAGMKRDGAILPYDNAIEKIHCNWEQENNWSDANEGRERLGSATFLAYLAYQQKKEGKEEHLTPVLRKYASFVRTHLQDEDFRTWTDADKENSPSGQKTRFYNYPWVAHFYCVMAMLTGEKEYAEWACGTILKCYAHGGYKFYYIDMPVTESVTIAEQMCSKEMADQLLAEYCKQAEAYMATGLNFPKQEVNYEQSIVAPSVSFLCELALVLKSRQPSHPLLPEIISYVKETMPVVEAFGGQQPSSHLNDISIRHWDGFWFGRPQQWGDTFPHYWSCVTGECFMYFGRLTGDEDYERRAVNILWGNMSLFTDDGRGGAAFIYPTRVNEKACHGLNPFANDQDNALMYLMKWIDELE